METFGALVGALALFLLGLRLSAFFSGSETGFYRVSFLRLSIDAHAGDQVAKKLMWFVQNPGYFVATTLVGNNVANFLTTFAIGLAALTLFPLRADWIEIVATVVLSPVVFVCGELVPKNLYYRAPLSLLRRDALWIVFFYRLFLIVSFPLIGITKLIQKLGVSEEPAVELVLGRNRLAQLMDYGHREGLLTDIQGQLIYGLLNTAAEPIASSMVPASRVEGVADNASTAEVLDHAARHGLSHVAVRPSDSVSEWYGYVGVADLAVGRTPFSATIRKMPRVDAASSKLETLLALRNAGATLCAVSQDDSIVGVVGERILIEQLFRSPRPIGVALASRT